jgi:hypothetical protein
METTQTQQESAEEFVDADLPFSNDELICANCGYWAVNDEGYAYHTRLCAVPA